ncbi:MAG: lipopolysaccharide transport periplasmic protein LptA [Pseudomonadota bacterium]
MNPLRKCSAFFILISILCLCVPSDLLCEVSQADTDKADNQTIIIKADTLEIDNKQRIVTFTGNVDARRDGFIINCEKMLLYYESLEPEKKKEKEKKENFKIDKIIATGKVRITRTDGGIATSEKAVYYQDGEKLVLTGNPVVKRGDDLVEGTTITLFLKEDRSIVEGTGNQKVRAVLSPRGAKR